MDFTISYRARRILRAYQGRIQPGMTVLDVGCGNGVVGARIAQAFQCRVTGTDILDYVKTGLPFVRSQDDGRLPFGDGSFDCVMLNDMLHHVPTAGQEALIREALRVGRQLLIFEVEPSLYVKFTDWLPNKVHNPMMRISLTHRPFKEWTGLLERWGDVTASKLSRPRLEGALSWPERLTQWLYTPVVNYCFFVMPKV